MGALMNGEEEEMPPSPKTIDILLSSEERFDVWNVKKEERPYLLSCTDENDDENASIGSSSERDIHELPLLDGCDIPGWRKQGLVSVSSSFTKGILNVGSGCSLLRGESQLLASVPRKSRWKELQKLLFVEPTITKTAPRLSPEETRKLATPYPWFERENRPVILEGCAEDWPAMKSCKWDNLLHEHGDFVWRFSDTHGACMTLRTYSKYARSIEGLTDDAPLAIYDSQFHLDERASLLNSYQVPPCFDGFDLFQDVMLVDADADSDVDEKECQASPPPYRWILMGPARSGA